MPSTVIEVRRQYSEAEEIGIIDAVQDALVDAFRIPPQDKHVRLVVHAPHRFGCPPGRPDSEYATMVTIDCFAGRSRDAKRALYAGIVDRLGVFGIPPEHVTIVVRDLPTENWGIRGGKAACDVELGFDVNV